MAVVFHPGLSAPAQPRVSVCIANFNGEALLADCIDSVLVQDTDAQVEILVHDDASRDGSVALLRTRYPHVHVIVSTENVGFCIGNNRMVARARGDFVLLLNNDAALAPDAIRCLLSEALFIGTPAILTLPQHDWDTGAPVDRGCLLDPFYNPIPTLDPDRVDVAYVIGACLWCPRETWAVLGGFPEWMGSIAEDLYLCGIARLRGLPVRALRESQYRHRQGHSFGGNRVDESGLHSTYRRRALSERNKTFALAIMTPSVFVVPLLAAHLVLLALEGIALSGLRLSGEPWRRIYGPALAETLRERHQLRSHRREVQSARTSSASRYFSVIHWLPRKLGLLLRHGVPTLR